MKQNKEEEKFRNFCYTCLKAREACICKSIEKIQTKIQVIILQHPKEKMNAIGTARIVKLSLDNSKLYLGIDFSKHQYVNALLENPDHLNYILYPSEQSVDVSLLHEHSSDQVSSTKQTNVFILDGTWSQANKILKASPNLLKAKHIKFNPQTISNYRIRTQPKSFCVSTVEASNYILSYLENDFKKFEPLLKTFKLMIDYQIIHTPPIYLDRKTTVKNQKTLKPGQALL